MTSSMTPREWLDAATGGVFDANRLERYADAHVYIAHRLLRLWDAPVEGIAPADVFSAEWTERDEER
jgi:hypothetical protein